MSRSRIKTERLPDENDHDNGHEDGQQGDGDNFPNRIWPGQSRSPGPDCNI